MRRLNPDLVIAAILACSTFALYSPTLGFDFVNYDDGDYVTENPHVLTGLSAADALWAFMSFDCANWHPITWLSLQMDVSLFDSSARSFHRTNVLLHATNAALLFLALRALDLPRAPVAYIALLFAWHPLRVESVAWISERKDVLSTLFGLLALWSYARYARSWSWRWYGSVAVFFALSLMAKPMLVTLPFLLLVLDIWPLRRSPSVKLLAEKLPLFALVAASCVVTVFAQQKALSTFENISVLGRVSNVPVAYVQYLLMTVWPLNLAPLYPHPAVVKPFRLVVALFVLAAITLLALRARTRHPYLLVGWLWFLGTLVPVIGLVQVGSQAYADRYTYFPLIGIYLAFALGAEDLLVYVDSLAWRRRIGWAGVIGTALACAVLTTLQASYWRNGVTLWRHALTITPDCAYSHFAFAGALKKTGDAPACLQHLAEAARLDPGNGEFHLVLGDALVQAGDLVAARAHFETATRIEPKDARAHNDLGALLEKMGDVPGAEDSFRKAVSLDPKLTSALSNLGLLFLNRDDPTAALPFLETAVGQNPQGADLHNNLGLVLGRLGRESEAEHEFREAVRLNPGLGVAFFNLGMAQNKRGDFAAAVETFRAALKVDPGHAASYFGLGSSLERSGRPAEALAAYRQAVTRDPEWRPYRKCLAVLDCRLAWSLATNPDPRQRDGTRAVALAEEAQRALGSPDPGSLDVLAAAYAEAGRYKEAVAAAQKALSATPPPPGVSDRLSLYESGRPYHASAAGAQGGR